MILNIQEKKILDDHLDKIIKGSYAMSSSAIWFWIEDLITGWEHQKEGFLYILEILLRQGKVKMGRGHKLLDMSIKEVIEAFRNNWPSEEKFEDEIFGFINDPNIGGYRFWTPGDLVWIYPDDGHELWSTDADY